MKEYLPDDYYPQPSSNPYYPVPKAHRFQKRWQAAKTMNLGTTAKTNNQLIEYFYKDIILVAKELYAPLETLCYEKDSREDNTENSFTMHSFLCDSFYWQLECPLCYFYQVNYDFYNCPFEQELQRVIDGKFWEHLPNAHRYPLRPNCKVYFRRVQQVQPAEHFYLLKA